MHKLAFFVVVFYNEGYIKIDIYIDAFGRYKVYILSVHLFILIYIADFIVRD